MITEQHSGLQVAEIINVALDDYGAEVTIGNESGQSVATKLNGVFGNELITSSLSGSEFAQAVEYGLNNLTPHDTLRLLHISDTHGYTAALEECRAMLAEDSSISHVIITGDLTQYSPAIYTTETLAKMEELKALGDRLLLIKGNHDAIDNGHTNLANVTDIENYSSASSKMTNIKKFEKAMMGHSENGVFIPHVNWAYPSVSNTACYYYKDISVNGHTLRIIAIDDYETQSKYNNTFYVAYNQAQATWLLNLLADTPSNYHILMMTHEPPCKHVGGQEAKTMRPNANDTEQELMKKLFVSELHTYWHERPLETDNWLSIVMKAYLHKEILDTTWTNHNGNFGTLTLQKDFSQNEPATLVGWAFGHLHNDVIGWMPFPDEGFDDQLLLGICAADSSVKWASMDDLLWDFSGSEGQGKQYATNEPTYRINEYIIDFTANRITVIRHGNMTTTPMTKSNGSGTVRPFGLRVRDRLLFNLETRTVTHPTQ